jgi:hypothetical protein
MPLYLATFVVKDVQSDTNAINSAVSLLNFVPVIRAVNMHVFLIRSEKSREQLESLFTECLDPADFAYVVAHPAPNNIPTSLAEALEWLQAES